jgi:O-antigen/teichoic acid export membrane protein
MPAVVAGVLAWQVGMYAQKPLEFVARTKLMLRWGLLSAGLNLILNLALVPSLGYVAAAYTTVASFAVYTISVGLEGLKVLGWRVSWSRVAFEGSILAVGFSLAGALRAILQESLGGWLSVLLALGIISLTMGALLARRVLADREKMGQ